MRVQYFSTETKPTEAWTNALEPEWSTSRRFRPPFGLKRLKMMSFLILHPKPRTAISPHAKCIPRRADYDAALKTAVRAIPAKKLAEICRKSRFRKNRELCRDVGPPEATFPVQSTPGGVRWGGGKRSSGVTGGT